MARRTRWIHGRIYRIVDGDTVDMIIRCRIANYYAPELSTKEGRAAHKKLRSGFPRWGKWLFRYSGADQYNRLLIHFKDVPNLPSELPGEKKHYTRWVEGKIYKVVDGDTIDMIIRCRISQYYTQELSTKGGRFAKQLLSLALPRWKTFELRYAGADKYQRLLIRFKDINHPVSSP